MNKKDLIIAFLLGIVCTQIVQAQAPPSYINRKDLLDAARIIGYGEAASRDILSPIEIFEHLIEKIK